MREGGGIISAGRRGKCSCLSVGGGNACSDHLEKGKKVRGVEGIFLFTTVGGRVWMFLFKFCKTHFLDFLTAFVACVTLRCRQKILNMLW